MRMAHRSSMLLPLAGAALLLSACGGGPAPPPAAEAVAPPAPDTGAEAEAPPAPDTGAEAEAPPAAEGRPAWQAVSLTDVRTGETFAIQDFEGQVVILEAMAVWCPLCDRQQEQIKAALEQLGDGVVAVSLDVDPGENADLLAAHADQLGLSWRFALAGPELSAVLQGEFGPEILTPPATPVVIIGPDGAVYPTPSGQKAARALVALVQPLMQ